MKRGIDQSIRRMGKREALDGIDVEYKELLQLREKQVGREEG
jgi:hypothetical protein